MPNYAFLTKTYSGQDWNTNFYDKGYVVLNTTDNRDVITFPAIDGSIGLDENFCYIAAQSYFVGFSHNDGGQYIGELGWGVTFLDKDGPTINGYQLSIAPFLQIWSSFYDDQSSPASITTTYAEPATASLTLSIIVKYL